MLITHAHSTVAANRCPELGRLVQPRHFSSIKRTAEAGIPWAADNDAFKGFRAEPFAKMLALLVGLPGCLFVAAPDVVADSEATATLFEEWEPRVHAAGLPVALVAQDGLTAPAWDRFEALFVGGSTAFKMGEQAARLVREAKRRGKWVHMGRVNSLLRARYAGSIGVDSIDGQTASKFPGTYLEQALDWVRAPQQLSLSCGRTP